MLLIAHLNGGNSFLIHCQMNLIPYVLQNTNQFNLFSQE